MKIKQLVVAQWDGDSGLTYSLYAVDETGLAYRMAGSGKTGWTPMAMKQLAPMVQAESTGGLKEKPWEKRKRLAAERAAAKAAEAEAPEVKP